VQVLVRAGAERGGRRCGLGEVLQRLGDAERRVARGVLRELQDAVLLVGVARERARTPCAGDGGGCVEDGDEGEGKGGRAGDERGAQAEDADRGVVGGVGAGPEGGAEGGERGRGVCDEEDEAAGEGGRAEQGRERVGRGGCVLVRIE
jgi:hypothetical protein